MVELTVQEVARRLCNNRKLSLDNAKELSEQRLNRRMKASREIENRKIDKECELGY
jgi:hypothetical protein|tara:strand:+ start:886 stop:1053 length:168 start_codon:yes stop_codon:yes gene_type:complete